MKKTVLVVAALVAVIATQSCSKKKTVVASNTVAPTATITGNIKAEIDLTNAVIEKASGATVYLIIHTKDLALNPATTLTYADNILKTTVDGSGKYTFTNFPVGNKAMDVEIRVGDFETTRILSATTSEQKVFKAPAAMVNVFATGTFIQDFVLN
jgi:hypothetical protein